jgi:hypothetical protein
MDLDEIPARLKLKSITFDLVRRVASKNVRGASTPPNEILSFCQILDIQFPVYSGFAARNIAPRASDEDASLMG